MPIRYSAIATNHRLNYYHLLKVLKYRLFPEMSASSRILFLHNRFQNFVLIVRLSCTLLLIR